MTDTTEVLLERVRKLLAKAEKTDNPHEADAFAAKAAEMIALHRIAPERLRSGATGRLELRRMAMGRGAYVRGRLALLGAVAEAHDAQVVFQSGPDGMTAIVAGFGEDLDLVAVLYGSLHAQAATQMAAVRRRTPAATQRWRRAFLFGYASRVGELLADARRGAEETAAATGTTLPDLPARADEVRRFVAESFGRVVAARRSAPAAAAAWQDGHRAAGGADIGRARLTARPAIGPGGS